MAPPNKKRLKNKPIWWRVIELSFIILFVGYVVPAAKHSFFPDQMTKFEKMLRRSSLIGYNLAVDRKRLTKIILTVYDGGRSITTEIYRDVVREVEPAGNNRVFFAYSLNRDSNEIFYLTRTKIEADPDLKQVRRLEVTVCGRLKDQHAGVTRFDGYVPVYECEVPEQRAVCLAAVSATESD